MTKQFEDIKIGDQVYQTRLNDGVVTEKAIKGKLSYIRVRFENTKQGWYERKYTLSQISTLNFKWSFAPANHRGFFLPSFQYLVFLNNFLDKC